MLTNKTQLFSLFSFWIIDDDDDEEERVNSITIYVRMHVYGVHETVHVHRKTNNSLVGIYNSRPI